MKSLEVLIDELEREFYDSKGFLFSKKSLVDVDKCTALLAQLKGSLPSSAMDINYLQSERSRVVYQAEKIIEEAERRASYLTSNSELVRRAEIEADKIKQKAINSIKEYENTAMGRLSMVLTDIESFLSEAVAIVRQSKNDLQQNIIRNSPKDMAVQPGDVQKSDSSVLTYEQLIEQIK